MIRWGAIAVDIRGCIERTEPAVDEKSRCEESDRCKEVMLKGVDPRISRRVDA